MRGVPASAPQGIYASAPSRKTETSWESASPASIDQCRSTSIYNRRRRWRWGDDDMIAVLRVGGVRKCGVDLRADGHGTAKGTSGCPIQSS